MKDKELKLEEMEASHTIQWSYQIHLNTLIKTQETRKCNTGNSFRGHFFQGFDFIKGSTFFHETSLKFHEISTISFHMLW
jgi:hypothetical protein